MLQFNDRKLFIKLLNLTILPSSRNIVRIPDWEYHIRFDQRQGRKRPNQDALDRLKRLNNGMWIRAKPGRYHGHYKKDEYDQKLNDQWETCTKEQCAMLDAMMTPFWLRPKHYVNDPFEPYHTRYDIQSPRVNEKKRFVRERPKILLDDLTADRFFDRLPPHKTKSTLLIEQTRSDLPKLLKNASKKQLSLPISIVEQE